jgi:signal transduction histidine kinase
MEAIGERGSVLVTADVDDAPSGASVPYHPAGRSGDPWERFEQVAVIRVADDGPGIGTAERSRIFYPFFTTKEGGSGVGLATAKKIVATHHGWIEVDSTPGLGAEFIVRLPMVQRP